MKSSGRGVTGGESLPVREGKEKATALGLRRDKAVLNECQKFNRKAMRWKVILNEGGAGPNGGFIQSGSALISARCDCAVSPDIKTPRNILTML